MNRGIARRTVFESRAEMRYFLAQLAKAVRRGEIEVHAFALMSTHFHLLLRSPDGKLSEALMRIEHAFVRWFNRRHRRDGSLFRGRFHSRTIESDQHWLAVVRYIDRNPVEAGLCSRPQDHLYGSAFHYARLAGPRWLTRGVVEARVRRASRLQRYEPAEYAGTLGGGRAGFDRWVVQRRLLHTTSAEDELDQLAAPLPARVLAWMRRKARLADGVPAGECIADPDSVIESIEAARRAHGTWPSRCVGRSRDRWSVLAAGLMQQACGATNAEIARRLGSSTSTISRHVAEHRAWVDDDSEYGQRAAQVLMSALGACFGHNTGAAGADTRIEPPAARKPDEQRLHG